MLCWIGGCTGERRKGVGGSIKHYAGAAWGTGAQTSHTVILRRWRLAPCQIWEFHEFPNSGIFHVQMNSEFWNSMNSEFWNFINSEVWNQTRPCAFPETGKPEPKPMPVRGLRASSAWGRKFGFSVSETAQGQVLWTDFLVHLFRGIMVYRIKENQFIIPDFRIYEIPEFRSYGIPEFRIHLYMEYSRIRGFTEFPNLTRCQASSSQRFYSTDA